MNRELMEQKLITRDVKEAYEDEMFLYQTFELGFKGYGQMSEDELKLEYDQMLEIEETQWEKDKKRCDIKEVS